MATDQPSLKQYKLTQDFASPNINVNPDGTVSKKNFSKDSTVSGYVPMINPQDGLPPMILVDSQWAIPLVYLIDPNASLSPVDALKKDISAVKNNTFAKNIADAAKMNMKAVLVGAALGIVAAWFFGKSKLMGGIIGAVGGAYIGKKMTSSSSVSTTASSKPSAPAAAVNASSSADGKTNEQILKGK